jgi:acetyl-CoA carboxylase biotin carboxyl carrier protein
MTISEIQDLIKFIAKSGVTEVEIEKQDFKITIKADPGKRRSAPEAIPLAYPMAAAPVLPAPVAAPAAAVPAPAAPSVEAPATDDSRYVTIKSPMIGTFYRKPAPDKPQFVEVGSSISKGSVLCVIEAMKLFNEIESEHAGKVVKILVDDNSPVEYDQPLFLIDPS